MCPWARPATSRIPGLPRYAFTSSTPPPRIFTDSPGQRRILQVGAFARLHPDREPPEPSGRCGFQPARKVAGGCSPTRPLHGAAGPWLAWRRRHQTRSAWYHQRTRIARDAETALVS